MKTYAYIRVSSREQNMDRQLAAIAPYHLPNEQIYCEWQSGKDFRRPAWQALLCKLQAGDLLLVLSIDRLGRNYEEILEQWRYITKTLRAEIMVLDMPLLDTRQKEGNLTGALISDLVLQILAYVAETEREFIHRRQAEGIAAARARGAHLGRKPLAEPAVFAQVCERYGGGALTARDAAAALEMSRASFYRRYQGYLAQNVKIP